MQEVDEVKVESYWAPLLKDLGLVCKFHTFPKKPHGALIAYRESLLSLVDEVRISYDDDMDHSDILQLNTTRNTGFAVALQFRRDVTEGETKGVIIGNSHLFWHPDGSYERARQLGVLALELEKFGKKFEHWPILLGGDFNSSPDDIPYTFLIKRPAQISDIPPRTLDIFKRSVAYISTKQVDPEAIEHISLEARIKSLISLYQQIIDHDTISFYGEKYYSVHPENSLASDYGEPAFSNWAHSWRGLLDYIFYFKPKNLKTPQVRALQLLRMPLPTEMGEEPNGQPREGQYPSDHLCIMATLSIC